MDDTNKIILIISLIIHFLIIYSYKYILKKKIYIISLIIAVIIGLLGYLLERNGYFIQNNFHGSIFFYQPLTSLLFVGFFWIFTIEIYGDEPILTRANAISWDQGHDRRLHWGDVIFTIFSIGGPLLVIVSLTNVLYK